MTLLGLYQAVVVDAVDPSKRRRVKVAAPAHMAVERWALPCASPGTQGVPPQGAAVWIMFEEGDPDRPVWMGVRG